MLRDGEPAKRARRRRGSAVFAVLQAAALALCALSAAAASASPEIGRCVVQTSGKYTDANCTVKGTTKNPGSHEWLRNAVRPGFTATGGESRVRSVSGVEASCAGISESGEYVVALHTKEAHHVVIAMSGCEPAPPLSAECKSKGAAFYEIVSRPLKGKLAYISGKHTPSVVVGQLLAPEQKAGPFREWECPAVGAGVREAAGPEGGHATVIATIAPVNVMSTTFTEVYRGSKGEQEPQHIEGSTVIDNLELSLNGGPFERAAQVAEMTLTTEEPLEIKA